MPDKCKNLFEESMHEENYDSNGNYIVDKDREYREDELEFLSKHRTLEDFKIGLQIPCKLLPKRIEGGVLLVNTDYQLRD